MKLTNEVINEILNVKDVYLNITYPDYILTNNKAICNNNFIIYTNFEYINIMLDTWQWILILALTIIYNVGISIYIIKNDYTEDNPNGVVRRFY